MKRFRKIFGTCCVLPFLAWQSDFEAVRRQIPTPAPQALWDDFAQRHPVPADWLLQDLPKGRHLSLFTDDPIPLLQHALAHASSPDSPTPPTQLRALLDTYHQACSARRARRITPLPASTRTIVFTKRRTIRPSFFAYTEGQSDAQAERHFLPGAQLCLLELDPRTLDPRVRTLLDDPTGVIRDPAVSWDATRILFAWKRALDSDDYHIHELDLRSGRIRQITRGIGCADYEPVYLPNDDILFSSTRCVQTVDCWWTEVSNLYTCAPDGSAIRRLGFDQVHTISPSILDDGRVIYTRWDYNDRGQIYPQALFQMNADGTGQTEFYGNNSWFPTTITHARGIPGTGKVLATFCGHHTAQAGKLGLIDPARGRQENQGATLVAPIRPTPAERIDAYGQSGELFQHPHPIGPRDLLVAYAPLGWRGADRRKDDAAFAIYWMDLDGNRELLVADPLLPCQQPVPLAPRRRPPIRPPASAPAASVATCYIQDVHAGDAMQGVPRGEARRLRVVALEFRAAGVGNNYSRGPGGGALASTPIAVGNGSWDVKRVLGTVDVEPDGSVFFQVPARTPLYFQLLDARGCAIQTMRSWTTLQPGENQSCVGCHESKNSAPPVRNGGPTLALRKSPQTLHPPGAPPPGFSFPREIQPILDRHCVSCHNDRSSTAASDPPPAPPRAATSDRHAFSLLAATTLDPLAKRHWSDGYLALVGARYKQLPWHKSALIAEPDGRLVNWIGAQSPPSPLPPRAAGAIRSALIPMLETGHGGTRLSRQEIERIACWIDLLVPYCGDYTEANAWTEVERAKYEHFAAKRRRLETADATR